jgi:heat shock protein HslJ
MKKILIVLLAMVILAACTGSSAPSIQGQWKLVSYGPPGPSANQIPTATDVETSIEFDSEGQMSGNVGCNGFGGEYSVDGDTITFGPVMSTLMFCDGPVGGQETATLGVFFETATFTLDGDLLTITSADGTMSIVLERK